MLTGHSQDWNEWIGIGRQSYAWNFLLLVDSLAIQGEGSEIGLIWFLLMCRTFEFAITDSTHEPYQLRKLWNGKMVGCSRRGAHVRRVVLNDTSDII